MLRQLVPGFFYQNQLLNKLKQLRHYDELYILDRVNYYNKLDHIVVLDEKAVMLKDMPVFKNPKTYYLDAHLHTRFFSPALKIRFLSGDVNHVESLPTIQKSRPLWDDNKNAVLLKLDRKRHFVFVKDTIPFQHKKDILIGRGAITQPHRIKFMEQYFNNSLCDLGQVNKKGGNTAWIKPKLPISAHLKYKFILSLEGNDVATNLKWIMSSNSVAVMPKPTHETWFMEARLIPDYHYIAIADDFSDLEEKLHYYISHPDKAIAIAENANRYVQQFKSKEQEELIALLVLDKYFYYTSQALTWAGL